MIMPVQGGGARRNGILLLGLVGVLALAVFAGVVAREKREEGEENLPDVVEEMPPVEPAVTLPRGTPIVVSLETRLSTKESRAGDAFTAVVANPVLFEGEEAIPSGARISGRVLLAEQPGKAGGRGRLQLAFEQLTVDGRSTPLGSRSAVFESSSGTGKDVGLIGGGAAAGGILGGVLGDDAGDAAKGVVIGGAAGAAVSLLTRGPQLEFEPGTRIRFTLDQPVDVRGGKRS